MITKTAFTIEDIVSMMGAIYEYNHRGSVVNLSFYDEIGRPLPVAWMEAVSDEKGLSIRIKPEPTPEQIAASFSQAPMDPKAIPQPASLAELKAMME